MIVGGNLQLFPNTMSFKEIKRRKEERNNAFGVLKIKQKTKNKK